MVQPFKCDICRARKIKCDQKQPICSACMVKNRHCTYQRANHLVFVVESANEHKIDLDLTDQAGQPPQSLLDFRVRRSTEVDGGYGLYQTLQPRRVRIRDQSARDLSNGPSSDRIRQRHAVKDLRLSPSVSAPLSHLIGRWSLAIENGDASTTPLHVYANMTPIYLARVASGNTDKTLELAIEYFVHSAEQFLVPREAANSARAVGHQALRRLQYDLCGQYNDENMMLAILLHEIAECFMSLGTMFYTCHTLGCSLLLQQRFKSGRCTDLDFMLLQAIHNEEVTEALLSQRDSLFDIAVVDEAIDQAIVQQRGGSAASLRAVKQFSKMPRLARLTRVCVATPDHTLIEEAITLARSIYCSEVMDDFYEDRAKLPTRPTCTCRVRKAVAESYDFESVEMYSLTVRRAAFISLVCGSLQKLLSLSGATQSFDKSLIEASDVEAATVVAMSADYAFYTKQAIPLLQLRILVPIQFTIGAWARLWQRGAEASEYGREMLDWTVEMSNYIMTTWKMSPDSLDVRTAKADALVGGLLTDGMKRRVDWSGVWQSMGS